jgi:hypothetical protein
VFLSMARLKKWSFVLFSNDVACPGDTYTIFGLMSFRRLVLVISIGFVAWSSMLWQVAFQRGMESCPEPTMRLSKDIGMCMDQLREEHDFFVDNPKHARVYCEAIVNGLTTTNERDVAEMVTAMRNAVDVSPFLANYTSSSSR